MKNILVISGDNAFLQRLENDFLKLSDQYRLFTTGDGSRGLNILRTEHIDFIAQSLTLPRMDGNQFLYHLRQVNSSVPIVIMVSEEATHMGDVFLKLGVLQVLVEPVSTNRLTECIQEILFLKSQEGRLKGISLVNFLQLMEMEKKTYLLEVRKPNGNKGLFYFHEGILFDALCGDLNGQEAAVLMINWDNVEIGFRTPPMGKVRKRIDRSLMALLMDAALLKDEKDHHDRVEGRADLIQTPEPDKRDTGRASSVVEQKSATSPPSRSSARDKAAPDPRPSLNTATAEEFMGQIFNLRGVRAVLLLEPEGKVVAEIGGWAGLDVARFAKAVFIVHGGADRMIRELRMARLETFALEAEGIVIMCLPSGQYLLAILARDSGLLGVIRQKALKVALEMERMTRNGRNTNGTAS